MLRKIFQRPDDNRGHENHRTHLLEILHTLVPHVDHGVAERRDAIRRQFHHELVALLLKCRFFHNQRGDNRHHNTEKINAGENKSLVFREECGNEQQIDRQSRRTRHERHRDNGEDSVFAVLQRSRGHDGGHTAPKANDVGDERLAVQPHPMHQFVHDEGRASHVARVFQNRDEKEEYQDVRQERTDAAHTCDNAVHYKGLEDAVGQEACGDIT